MAKPNAKVVARKRTRQNTFNIAEPKSKLDLIVEALRRPSGAGIAVLTQLTGWQGHSLRGAMSGALKKRGLTITSTKNDAERRYQIARSK